MKYDYHTVIIIIIIIIIIVIIIISRINMLHRSVYWCIQGFV
jgi:hypothetical protein